MVRFLLPTLAILVLLGAALYFHSEMRRVALKVAILEADLAVVSAEQDATVDWFIDADQWEAMTSTVDSGRIPSRGRYSRSR